MERDEIERIATAIVDAAYRVHKTVGPGLAERFYESLLDQHLRGAGLRVDRQVSRCYRFEGVNGVGRITMDLIVEDAVVVEVKVKNVIREGDRMQLRTYLRLTGYMLGLVLNFGAPLIKQGIRRVVNGL